VKIERVHRLVPSAALVNGLPPESQMFSVLSNGLSGQAFPQRDSDFSLLNQNQVPEVLTRILTSADQ